MTEIFVPVKALGVVSLVQKTLVDRSVRNWRVKLLNGAGQAIRTRLLLIKLVIESDGNGQTVVTVETLLFAWFASSESVATEAVFVMSPTAVGLTVNVTVAVL